jgi:hypothetical protein
VNHRALNRLACLCGCLIVGFAASPHAAKAQQFDPTYNPVTTFDPNNVEADSFDRGQNVSVRERPRPDYQAVGIHLGGFTLYPKLTASLSYDDNIFATPNKTTSDWFASIAPELDLQSNWSRNAFAAYVRGSQSLYFSQTTENTTQYGVGANGKYEFGGGAFGDAVATASIDYGRYTLPREAAFIGQNSIHPVQYDFTELNGQIADTLNRLRLSVRADYAIYDYLNAEAPGDVFLFEEALNHSVATFTGKAEYAVSPDTAVFADVSYNDRVYDHQPPFVPFNENNQGYNVDGGANFDLTHLIRGEVQIGYMDQTYSSVVFRTISGLTAKAQLEWFPTQLTTVTATALRTVGDSGLLHSSG